MGRVYKHNFTATELKQIKAAITDIVRANEGILLPEIADKLNDMGIRQPNNGSWNGHCVQSFIYRKMGGLVKMRNKIRKETTLPLTPAATVVSTRYVNSENKATDKISLASLVLGLNFPDDQKEQIIRSIFVEG